MGDRYGIFIWDVGYLLDIDRGFDIGYRYGIWYAEMGIYHIDALILGIDMGYGLMIWEMTISIWSSSVSILWDILSLSQEGH